MYDLKPSKLTYITGQCNNPHPCDSTELVKEAGEIWCRKCCWKQGNIRDIKGPDTRLIKGMPAAEYHRKWNQKRLQNKKGLCKCGCGREVSLRGNQKYATPECPRQGLKRKNAQQKDYSTMGMAV